ncbi:MAG: LytR/AlgR family response regulator transcription factor [Megasphaera sp.]|uniref:LytR/AlgR family response regulator transcription factor n=1 Tax=Megasphaera sp. TaxID=2023260 RepID=UPI003F0B8BB8
MVRIGICDDLQEQLVLIEKAARKYFQDKKEPIEVSTYTNAMDFLDDFEKLGTFDIVLLDICMPGILGTDVAAEMRKQKSRAEIVFLSTSEEFAVDAFAVKAAHYLVKPFTQDAFNQAMDRVMDSLRQRHSGKVVFKLIGGGIQVEELNAILYVESTDHIQKVYTSDNFVLETRQSLSSILDMLEAMSPGQFVSPGKGYLVNQGAIRVVKSDYIEIQGHQIPLAKRKYRQFQENYLKYIFGQPM